MVLREDEVRLVRLRGGGSPTPANDDTDEGRLLDEESAPSAPHPTFTGRLRCPYINPTIISLISSHRFKRNAAACLILILAVVVATLIVLKIRTESRISFYKRKYVRLSQMLSEKLEDPKLLMSDPEYAHVVPGSRGVVFMGPSRTVDSAIMAVTLLRATGCVLPIEFAYLSGELTDKDIKRLESYNITTRDFRPAIANTDWGKNELKLGAPKVDAIVSSPFEQLLFMDPDVMALQDPTTLFTTPQFKATGALFWPDFMATEPSRRIWDIMSLTQADWKQEREFETGQLLVDKRRVWYPLILARHICRDAKFFFDYVWGDKDTFRWGFRVLKVPYFLNPNYLVSVGVMVDWAHPKGNLSLLAQARSEGATATSWSPPPKATFCGQSMLQLDFDTSSTAWTGTLPPPPPPPSSSTFKPKGFFLHANGLKKYFLKDIPPFQVSQSYVPVQEGSRVEDFAEARNDWLGEVYGQNHCVKLRELPGLKVDWGNFTEDYPGVNELYIQARLASERQ